MMAAVTPRSPTVTSLRAAETVPGSASTVTARGPKRDRLADVTELAQPLFSLSPRLPVSPSPVIRQANGRDAVGVTRQPGLVLSLFPGIDLLGRAFRETGFCVVTGPERMFGQDVRDFSIAGLAGRLDGILGGPPCQDFSSSRRCRPSGEGVEMLREFLRIVAEAGPTWFLLENVPRVPDVRLDGYAVQRFDLWDAECGGRQLRCRHFQFGHRLGWICRPKRTPVTPRGSVRGCVTRWAPAMASQFQEDGKTFRQHCLAQGLPGSFRAPGIRKRALWWAIGNAVPLGMGRVAAEAVLAAGPRDASRDCLCGCGRIVSPRAITATAACRKRLERLRHGRRRPVVTWP
jgi:DNA (cytosine-5)-methyltransferase 1